MAVKRTKQKNDDRLHGKLEKVSEQSTSNNFCFYLNSSHSQLLNSRFMFIPHPRVSTQLANDQCLFFLLQQQFKNSSCSSWTFLPRNFFLSSTADDEKNSRFLQKNIYENMCTASCKQKSPTEHCLLIISKLTQFLGAQENLSPWPRVAFGTWKFCKHVPIESWWRRKSKPYCWWKSFIILHMRI